MKTETGTVTGHRRYITTTEQLKGYAKQFGLSTAELARRASVSPAALYKLMREPDRTPNPNTLALLARYIAEELHVSPRTVFVNLVLGAGRVYDILHDGPDQPAPAVQEERRMPHAKA